MAWPAPLLPVALRLFAENGGEPEGRSLPLDAFDADFAAHGFDQALGNGQPQPGAAEAARGRSVHLLEGAEQQADLVGGNADARVPHLNADFYPVFAFRFKPDLNDDFAPGRELDGVAAQVDQDLAQAPGIALQERVHFGIDAADEFEVLFVGAHGQQFRRVLDRRPQVEIDGLQFQLAGLDLGKIEDVVDDAQQGFAARTHRLGVTALFRGQVGAQEQSDHADDAVHRRADLMAHVGQELAFGDVGRLGLDGQLVGPLVGGFEPAVGLLQLVEEVVQLFFGGFLLADIAQNAHGVPAAFDLDRGQRQGHGDFPAVLAQPLQFKGLADGRPCARAQELRESGVMRLVIALRGDQVMQVAAERFGAGYSRKSFRRPGSNRSAGPGHPSSGWRPGRNR